MLNLNVAPAFEPTDSYQLDETGGVLSIHSLAWIHGVTLH